MKIEDMEPGQIYLNKTEDGLICCPEDLLENVKVDQNKLIEKFKYKKQKWNSTEKGKISTSGTHAYGFGVEWQVGVRHGMRARKGITTEQELYLLYLENQWLTEEEARRDHGMESDPVAEIILNRLGEDEYIEMLESGEITPSKEEQAEAEERNKHNLEKDYHPESYLKLKEKAEEACQAYRS